MKKLYISILLLFTGLVAFAQLETTLPSMRSMYQSSYINPAFTPEYKWSVGIPVVNNIGMNVGLSGADIHTVAQCIDQTDHQLDFNKLYTKLDGPIGVSMNYQNDFIYIRFPIKGVYVGINNSLKVNNSVMLAKNFVGLLAYGNDYYKGQNLQFQALDQQATVYNETGLSLSKEFHKKFSVGIRVKYFQGVANVHTKNVSMNMYTGAEAPYPVHAAFSGQVQTSGIPLIVDSINGHPASKDDTTSSTSDFVAFQNSGWGLDLGMTYQVTEKLNVHASVVDLGSFITWKTKAFTYDLQSIEVNYSGFTYEQLNNKDIRQNYLDSMQNLLKKATATSGSYKTMLPTKFFIGADYDLNERNRVGILLQGQKYFGKFYPAYTLSYAHQFGKVWNVTTNYSLVDNAYSYVGLGTSLKLGALQLFYVQDNIISLFNPGITRSLYFRFGINLVWGSVKFPKAPKTTSAPTVPPAPENKQ